MFKTILEKMLSIDEVVLLKYIEIIYPTGMFSILVYFIISLGIALFDGNMMRALSSLALTVFLFIGWRVLCEILISVAPGNNKTK